jgi:carbon-monoxide dehydrogenase large subunit
MEHMISSSHSGTQMNEVRIAAKRDGTILGLDVKMWKDVGAYNHFEMMLEINTLNHMTTHYRVPALRCAAWAVATNTPPGAPFRGAGRVEACFIMDRTLDAIARETGLDPLAVRRKNVVTPAEMPYANGRIYRDGVPVTYKDLDFPLLLETAAERVDYAGWRKRQSETRGSEQAIGIGISSYVEAGGIGPCEGAMMRVDEAGRVWVHVGVNSQGQSHETTFAQIGAHELGAKYEDVRVLGGDTALMTFGFGTGASRVAINTGNAVAKAAGTLKKKMTAYAAQILDCPESEVEFHDSVASVAGARQNFISFGDLAARSVRDPRMAALGGPGLAATEYFYPRTIVWACGVNIAVVEVDRGTGRVKVLKYAFVHDSGKPLNPLVVDGQIYGGFAQGLGIALGEETMFDGDGQVLAGTMMDYYVPRASDVPDLELIHFAFPTDENPLGIKSVGEAGPNSPPSALAAAVEDALGGTVQIDKLPVTMRTVLDAVRARPQ